MKSRYKISKSILIFWCLFIGIGAIWGSFGMLIDPTGKFMRMDKMLIYFQVLPFANILFQNYIFSGISLLIVNGISNLTAAILLFLNKKLGIILGLTFGITLMLWILIQFIIFPFNLLSTSYFIFGFLQFITGLMCYIFYKQEKFKFNINDYKNINKNSNVLVVYFSRMNYTKKIAYNIANKNSYNILEIKTTEKTSNTSGFWWCGRYGMHRWNMPINDINEDLKKYEKIIICSPIWVFDISAPIRTFIDKYHSCFNKTDLVLVHYSKPLYKKVFDNISNKYKMKLENKYSIQSKIGKVIYYKKI